MDGHERNSTIVVALIDTTILVYRYDPRFPDKQQLATSLLRRGIEQDSVRVPHQAIVEFVAAVTRSLPTGKPLLSMHDACLEAEAFLSQFTVLYPNEAMLRLALRGRAAYRLSWFDAHLWAYAEYHGLEHIISEDFQHGRMYGSVLVVNPFLPDDSAAAEL